MKVNSVKTFNQKMSKEGMTKEEQDVFRRHYIEIVKELQKEKVN